VTDADKRIQRNAISPKDNKSEQFDVNNEKTDICTFIKQQTQTFTGVDQRQMGQPSARDGVHAYRGGDGFRDGIFS